jgi:O-methyltransferase
MESSTSTLQTQELYLQLLKNTLTYYLWGETLLPLEVTHSSSSLQRVLHGCLRAADSVVKGVSGGRVRIARQFRFDPALRSVGKDWPPLADTMIGLKRLENIQFCLEDILRNNVPGDLIETGVWRGGAVIFMRGILKAHNVTDRIVWAADSFSGLPSPDINKYPQDAGDPHHLWSDFLGVSLETVQRNFRRYGLLDDQVRFLKGWFKDTLPVAPMEQLSLLRLDGDMYESTMDALVHLYPKLSVGGYVIVDDYFLKGCSQAINDYRAQHNITDTMIPIDWASIYWQKGK